MPLADLIPDMSDADLKVLRANALRLIDTGEPKQQASATDILPVIDSEVAARLERQPPPPPKKTRKSSKAVAA